MAIQSDGKIVVAGNSSNGSDNDFALARYTTAGALDTTFGADGVDSGTDPDGYVTTDIDGNDIASAVAIQSDGKILAAGSADRNIFNTDLALVRYIGAGTLDTTFATGGKVTTAIGSGNDYAHAMALDSRGNILLAGYSVTGNKQDFALAAYTADGEPAAILDGPGWLTTAVGSLTNEAHALAVQSDGKIVAAGYSHKGASIDFAVARYDADGSPDGTFGTGGKATTAFGSTSAVAHAVAVQSDDKIVAAGYSDDDFALARYNADGSPDNSFDSDGQLTANFGGNDRAYAVSVQSDGKIVAAGHRDNTFAVARYNANGSPDNSFDGNGRVTTDISGNLVADAAQAVVIQSDGKIVAAGYHSTDFGLVRYKTDGTLDDTFGAVVSGDTRSGKVTTDIGGGVDSAYAMAVQADGKIVVAGEAHNGSDKDFALARHNANGTLDDTFGAVASGDTRTGKVTTAVGSGDDIARGVAVQADGKIVATGYSSNGSDNDFALVRYNADGTLDTSFGIGGKVTTAIGSAGDFAWAVAIQPDDRIVLAGSTTSEGIGRDFALARYLAGEVDTSASNANLSNLTAESSSDGGNFSALTLSPAFDAATTSYTATVPYGVVEARLTPTVAETGKATMSISFLSRSFPQPDGRPFGAINLPVGANVITVRVTAENGTTTKDYTVTITREAPSTNADLLTLTVGGATSASGPFADLSPSSASVGHFRFTVPNATTHARIISTVQDTGKATVAVGKQGTTLTAVPNGSATFSLAVGSGNVFTVRVTAEDATTTRDYTVTITREASTLSSNANLSNLTASGSGSAGGTFSAFNLSPAFSASTTSYTATVGNDVTHVKLTPTVADTGKATVQVGKSGNLATVASGSASAAVALDVGSNAILVTVTAEDASTTKTYTVTITREASGLSSNANLAGLAASSNTSAGGTFTALTLSPAFSASTTSYTATVGNDVTHAKLTPTVQDTGKARVAVGKSGGALASVSSGSASRAIALDVGTNAIIARVTAEDGTTTEDYTVTVTRQGPPTVSLSASPNPVRPEHDPDDPDLKKNTVTITATLSSTLSTTISIPVTLTQDESNPDHGMISSIVISANKRSGTHVIGVFEDIDTEDDTFTVSLDAAKLPSPVVAGDPAAVTVTIRDSDPKGPPGKVGNFTVTPKVRYLLLNWAKPTGRITHYEAQFKTAAAPNQTGSDNDPSTGWIAMPQWTAGKTDDAARGSTTDNTSGRITILPGGLTSGTAYDVRLRAVNWKAPGPWATGRGTPQ